MVTNVKPEKFSFTFLVERKVRYFVEATILILLLTAYFSFGIALGSYLLMGGLLYLVEHYDVIGRRVTLKFSVLWKVLLFWFPGVIFPSIGYWVTETKTYCHCCQSQIKPFRIVYIQKLERDFRLFCSKFCSVVTKLRSKQLS
jgi:hypothetical protein